MKRLRKEFWHLLAEIGSGIHVYAKKKYMILEYDLDIPTMFLKKW